MSDAWECNIGNSLSGIASNTCVRKLQKGVCRPVNRFSFEETFLFQTILKTKKVVSRLSF